MTTDRQKWLRRVAYDEKGDLKAPRTTALCYSRMHALCKGRCTPENEFLLPGEPTHETVACECVCHPVVVAP